MAVAGVFSLLGGQPEIRAAKKLNTMNEAPNPGHVSFSYAHTLQDTAWTALAGKSDNSVAAPYNLLQCSLANSRAQHGEYDPATASEGVTAAESMYAKGHTHTGAG